MGGGGGAGGGGGGGGEGGVLPYICYIGMVWNRVSFSQKLAQRSVIIDTLE